MERGSPWATLISAAGAAGAAAGLVYVIGGIVLSLRYEGFGLTGQQAVALTPREVLFFAGGRSLLIWALLGASLVLALRALPDAVAAAVAAELRRPRGVLVLVVVVVGLLAVLNVWWPLAALAALLVIIVATAHWRARPTRRFFVSAAAIALVAVAYEADRISFVLDWTCVAFAQDAAASSDATPQRSAGPSARRVCGILVAQNDRGFYIGAPQPASPSSPAAAPYELLFIPADRVERAHAQKQKSRAVQARADARREALPSRLLDIEVR